MSGTNYTLTANFSLIKPIYNADVDDWGEHWNINADAIDAIMYANQTQVASYLPLVGGTLTGPLSLAADPTTALGAATKEYVDAVGVVATAAVKRAGDTMTGPLSLAADPTTALGAATKEYVDAVGVVATAAVKKAGDTMTGPLILSADPTAPLGASTKEYVDAAAGENVGRNFIHNGRFNVQQRGAGPWTTNGYTVDRWMLSVNSPDAASLTITATSDAIRAAIGDESALYILSNTFTGSASGTNYIEHRIETVRRLSGKTVTVSFWAAASAALKISVNAFQWFGAGGSPSAPVACTAVIVTAGTTWTRYTVTFVMPSASGMTLGTNGDDATWLRVYYSAGASSGGDYTSSGHLGAQSGTVNLWGVQLEIGPQATRLETIDPVRELQQCMRFFQVAYASLCAYGAAANQLQYGIPFAVPMRATPTTVTFSDPSYGNCSNIVNGGATSGMVIVGATVTTTGPAYFNSFYMASADL